MDLFLPETTLLNEILLGFRFAVFFFSGGTLPLPNVLDIRFQKVKGLSATVNTTPIPEGGQNLYTHKVPTGISYQNLTLERGFVVGSVLNLDVVSCLTTFKFSPPGTVIVMLFSEDCIPVASWMFLKAYPVKWSTSDFDAEQKSVLIDTLELAYSQMQILRI